MNRAVRRRLDQLEELAGIKTRQLFILEGPDGMTPRQARHELGIEAKPGDTTVLLRRFSEGCQAAALLSVHSVVSRR